jgi:hypothetical protein
MSKEYQGPMIEPEKIDGKKLWEKKKGNLLKTESPTGNPLWKDKDRIDEKTGEIRKLNE